MPQRKHRRRDEVRVTGYGTLQIRVPISRDPESRKWRSTHETPNATRCLMRSHSDDGGCCLLGSGAGNCGRFLPGTSRPGGWHRGLPAASRPRRSPWNSGRTSSWRGRIMPTRLTITTGRSSSHPSRIPRCGTSWESLFSSRASSTAPQSLHQRDSHRQEFRRGLEQPGHRILHGEEVWKIGEVLPAGDRVEGRQCLFPYEPGHILLSSEEIRSGRGRVSHRSGH